MARLVGLMKRTDKIESHLDYMSGIAERHYDMVVFDGFSYRHNPPLHTQESILPYNIDQDIKVGDVAQLVYRGSYIEAVKAVPEQVAEFEAMEKAAK